MHIFHKWTKWADIGVLHRIGKPSIILARVQERLCVKCGKCQIRREYL